MIYTVTLNPALDYVVHTDGLNLGAVNRTTSEEIYYGGKGINVSFVLKTLGYDSICLGFIAGFTGDKIENGVKSFGVATDFIHLKEGMSRINIKLKSKEETDINGQGPAISSDEMNDLLEKIEYLKEDDMLVLAGSIPSSLSDDCYERILEKLCGKKVHVIVDATKDLLKNVLKYHPFLIKPNNFELGELFGVQVKSQDEIIYYAKQLQKLGARNVLVSMAQDGAILLDEEQSVHVIGVPKGDVLNSVGAGDSMVAGFIAGYMKTHDYGNALKLGTAAGSATAFSMGLASKELIDELFAKL